MEILCFSWIILLLITVVLFYCGRRDFVSPAFFLSFSFLAAFTVVLFNIDNWDIAIHGYSWKTTLCILITILSFSSGCLLVSLMSNKNYLNAGVEHFRIRNRNDNYPYIFFAGLSLVLFVLFLKMKIGLFHFSSIDSFKKFLRGVYTSERNTGFLSTQVFEALVALSYISFHRILVEKHYLKEKFHKLLMLPIIIFLLSVLLYTDRNVFIRFFVFALAAYVMSYNWKGIKIKNNRKLVVKVSLAVIVIVIIFWMYGHLKEYTSNLERMIGIYAGSGIYGFNLWLEEFRGVYTEGQITFSSLAKTLHAFGIGSGSNVPEHWEYIIYQSGNGYVFATNIYSAMRTYFQDFGILGLMLLPAIEGVVFEIFYQNGIKKKYGFWWIFYCAHIYHILYFPIAEQLFLRLHLGLFYEFFWLTFFYYLVYGKYGLWKFKIICSYHIN